MPNNHRCGPSSEDAQSSTLAGTHLTIQNTAEKLTYAENQTVARQHSGQCGVHNAQLLASSDLK